MHKNVRKSVFTFASLESSPYTSTNTASRRSFEISQRKFCCTSGPKMASWYHFYLHNEGKKNKTKSIKFWGDGKQTNKKIWLHSWNQNLFYLYVYLFYLLLFFFISVVWRLKWNVQIKTAKERAWEQNRSPDREQSGRELILNHHAFTGERKKADCRL